MKSTRKSELIAAGMLIFSLMATTTVQSQSTPDRDALSQVPSSLAPVTAAADFGFDPEKLQEIDQHFDQQIADGKIIGCAALGFKDGKVIYHKLWGNQNAKTKTKTASDTIWRIYSMSKPITSIATMQLVENGKLKLDEPVSSYLLEFNNLKVFNRNGAPVPCEQEMTVRDLLRHTSGLTYGFFGNSKIDKEYIKAGVLFRDKNLAEMTKKLGKIPLRYQPGQRWHYSVSTDVLGRVIEVASGETFKQYLDEHIFQPLDMNDTSFVVPESKQSRFAEMYRFSKGKLLPDFPQSSTGFLKPNEFYSGGGGLCSTTHDYLNFARMLLNEGELNGTRIIKPETHAKMVKDQLPKGAAARSFKFGLGFTINAEGHYSWGGAAGTRFWVDPKNKVITIFMIQIKPYKGNHGKKFKSMFYDAMVKSTP